MLGKSMDMDVFPEIHQIFQTNNRKWLKDFRPKSI